MLFPDANPAHGTPQPREERRPSLAAVLLPLSLVLLIALQALFIGQLSPYPLFWALLVFFASALLVPWLKYHFNRDLRGWLWFIPLAVVLTKLFFYPALSWEDGRWLSGIGQGLGALFGDGLILHAASLNQAAANASTVSALFLLVGLLFWLPLSAAMSGALRNRNWGWPLILTLLLLVWLEPLPSASFFFLPLLLLTTAVFLFAVYLQRRERWEGSRLEHSRRDLWRTLRWSLLIILPLLLLLVPWAVARFSYASLTLPSLTLSEVSVSLGSASIPAPPTNMPNQNTPLYRLPPLDMPESLTQGVSVASTVILLIAVMLLGYFLVKMGRKLTLGYFLLAAGVVVIGFWLLPPILGPVVGKLLYWLLVTWQSVRGNLGLGSTTTPSVLTATSSPETAAGMVSDFFQSLIPPLFSVFTHYTVWTVIIGAAVFLLIGFFVWRSLWKTKLLRGGRKRAVKTEMAQPEPPRGIFALYFRLLAFLVSIGLARRPAETPYELTRRASPALPWFKRTMERITRGFVLARYGGKIPPENEEDELRAELSQAELDAEKGKTAVIPAPKGLA